MSEPIERKCPWCGGSDFHKTKWVSDDWDGVDHILVKQGVLLSDKEEPAAVVCMNCGFAASFLNTDQLEKLRQARLTDTPTH